MRRARIAVRPLRKTNGTTCLSCNAVSTLPNGQASAAPLMQSGTRRNKAEQGGTSQPGRVPHDGQTIGGFTCQLNMRSLRREPLAMRDGRSRARARRTLETVARAYCAGLIQWLTV